MANGVGQAMLPLVALGCSVYAIWTLYGGWKEARSETTGARGPKRESSLASYVQWGLFVAFSAGLFATGLSIFGNTFADSLYGRWLEQPVTDSRNQSALEIHRFDGLPGVFEIDRSDPSHAVTGVSMANLPVEDGDVARLADRFPGIRWLHLQNTDVTNETLTTLKRFRTLRLLTLTRTAVDDRGLKELADVRSLEELILRHTAISDTGLTHLEGMANLKHLDLSGTDVSRKAVRRLRRRLPGCEIRI